MSTTTSSSTTTWPSWLPEPVYPIREKTIYPAIKTENKSPRPLARKNGRHQGNNGHWNGMKTLP